MTRKDFQLIAATIAALPREPLGSLAVEQIEIIAQHFAQALRSTNPNFDTERFVAACTKESGPANLKRVRQLHREATNGEG